MNYTQKAVKGVSILFVFNILAAFLGYLIRIVLARNLTVKEYGLFFAVITLVNFLVLFRDFGLSQALTKYIPEFLVKKKPGKISSSFFFTFFVQLFFAAIIALLIFIFSDTLTTHYFKDPLASNVLLFAVFILILTNWRELLRTLFQGFQNMFFYALMYLFENLLLLGALIVGFLFIKNIFTALYVHIVAYFVIVLVFFFIFSRVFNLFRNKILIKKPLVKKLFHYGFPTIFTGLGSMIILYVDTLILTFFRGLTAVAIYNVVVPTAMMLSFFYRSVSITIFPMISELYARKKNKLISFGVRLMQKYYFIVVLPVALYLFLFAELIIMTFFGIEYISGVLTFQILLAALLFLGMGSILLTVIGALGNTKLTAKIMLIAAGLNLVTNFIFIPWLGMLGAAITSLISYFLIMILSAGYLSKMIKLKIPLLQWTKTFFVGTVFIFLIFGLKEILALNMILEAVICLIVGAIAYVVLIFLFKIASIEEIKYLLPQKINDKLVFLYKLF